ncbi:hypothetical protein [Streptacidiphilus jiangxiensis]|nr:hypothetical protein [Streptacidiphilus jiangxiensis]
MTVIGGYLLLLAVLCLIGQLTNSNSASEPCPPAKVCDFVR